uniref:Uncharacterized protein n=1 Tax=Euplotes harpa TaxID=151035 RepID=A0A7S3J148_9SPIT|mmetsp:Transcript_11609/g.13184  ORF Transcript_11609/g.13184 Transcript_11609/m.13184 type:complete len:165 (+) Transcript_11609:221-715(+)
MQLLKDTMENSEVNLFSEYEQVAGELRANQTQVDNLNDLCNERQEEVHQLSRLNQDSAAFIDQLEERVRMLEEEYEALRTDVIEKEEFISSYQHNTNALYSMLIRNLKEYEGERRENSPCFGNRTSQRSRKSEAAKKFKQSLDMLTLQQEKIEELNRNRELMEK